MGHPGTWLSTGQRQDGCTPLMVGTGFLQSPALGQGRAQPQGSQQVKRTRPGMTQRKLCTSKHETSEGTLWQKYLLHTWDISRKTERETYHLEPLQKKKWPGKNNSRDGLRCRIMYWPYLISFRDGLSNLMCYFEMNNDVWPYMYFRSEHQRKEGVGRCPQDPWSHFREASIHAA